MATGKVTKRAVDALEAGPRNDFLWDEDLRGFGVKITPAGARSYVYQFRLGGRESKTRRYTIGAHGSPWTPANARSEAERLATLVAQGIDPVATDKERRRVAVDFAFSRYADTFLEEYAKAEWPGSYSNAKSMFRLHIKPVLGERPLPAIGRAEINAVLDRIDRTKVATRANVYAVMRRLFRWAVGRGDLDRSPLEGMEKPATVASRDRVLDDDELALVWRAAAGRSYPFGPMYRLLIATGQRLEEVAGLDWSELSQANAAWVLPAERAKNKNATTVPLSALAVTELDGLSQLLDPPAAGKPLRWPRKGLIFSTTGKTSVSGFSKAKRLLDAAVAAIEAKRAAEEEREPHTIPPWRNHDLRRTVSTGLQRLGVRFEVTEAVMNHVSGSKSGVAGVYQRHQWTEEKRDALSAWAAHISNLFASINIGERP